MKQMTKYRGIELDALKPYNINYDTILEKKRLIQMSRTRNSSLKRIGLHFSKVTFMLSRLTLYKLTFSRKKLQSLLIKHTNRSSYKIMTI